MTRADGTFVVALCLAVCGLPTAAAAQLHVAPTGNDGGSGTAGSPFRTINHAAAVAAPGATIYLHAGVYGDEQGIVQLGTKDLVVQGDDAATTILVPHGSNTIALLPADPALVMPVPHRVGIVLNGTARVNLRSLTIDAQASAPATGQLAGLYLRGGVDVVCDHVVVRNCRPAVIGSTPAHAVVVRGDLATDPTTLAMRDVAMTNFGSGAVRASLRAEIGLRECQIAGSGAATGPDQVGVWVQDVAIGTIAVSRITDCGGPAGTAVRLHQHGAGCLIEGNRIARAEVGIDVRHGPPSIVPGSVRNNRIAAVATTIAVQGTAGLFVTGNALFPISRFDATPYSDDSAGENVWAQNRYAVPPGTTAVSIPGGGNVDASPVASMSELGNVERVVCGGAPIAVVVADFDADGHDDFATLDALANGVGVTVGLWRPIGWSITSQSFGGSGARPVALATGSFDAVPGVDLVALTASTPPVTTGSAFWVFANDGAGAMSLLHQEPLPGHVAPSSLAVARLDADFRDDLVVTDLGAWPFTAGRADVFLDTGAGVGWTASPLPIGFTATAASVATGDIDGDGRADVAVVEASPTIGRLHWLYGDGFGGFATPVGSPFATPANPTRVQIVDVDADGDRDLVVAAIAGLLPLQRGAVQVFENRPGQLVATPARPVEGGPAQLCVADLDDDATPGVTRPELLVLHPSAGTATVFGSYERTTGYAGGGTMSLADTPVDLAAGDLDEDACRDVVVAEPVRGGVAVLHGSPTVQVETFGPGCPGTAGREPRLELHGTPGLPTLPNPTFSIGVVDSFPVTLGVCAVALGKGPAAVPCGYHLELPIFLLTAIVDADGRGEFGLPLAVMPDLFGLTFYVQAAIFDPEALTSFLPQFSLTAAMRLRIGD